MAKSTNRYSAIIEAVFANHYRSGLKQFEFERDEIESVAGRLNIKLPKNLGDLIYSFRYRATLPGSVTQTAPRGEHWIIRPAGRARYQFALVKKSRILPNPQLATTKILDSTPGMIDCYAASDEQALLAKVRYNRLLDIFTGVACYSLQNHWRTTTRGMGQVEIDEVYVGIDKHGAHFVFPVQAKGGRDQIGVVQVEQDIAVCCEKFAALICRPIAVQFVSPSEIALFELGLQKDQVVVHNERHYRLVNSTELPADELAMYRQRSSQSP